MGKDKNIRYLMCRELESQIRIGTKKTADRSKQFRETGERKAAYIHSTKTVETYMQHARQYGDWLRERGMGRCSLAEAREHAGEYIRSMPSAYSQKTARSALGRVFGCKGQDLCQIGARRSEDIKRGRTMTDRAAAIERNHPREIEICRSTGVRFGKELPQLCPKNFFRDERGDLYVHLIGKGGRERDALVLGSGKEIIERDLASGRYAADEPICKLPSHANVHSCRADYAARCYQHAVEIGHVDPELKTYHGFDRKAIAYVDQMIGHGNGRLYTAVTNYLSYGDVKK